MKPFTIILFFLCFYNCLWSQEPFNKFFQKDSIINRYEKLIETDDSYIAIGYIDSFQRNSIGIQVVGHDKSSGEELSYTHFDILNDFLFVNSNVKPQKVNNKLRFAADATHLYDLEYDLDSHEVIIRDSFINTIGSGSSFIHDRKVYGDTVIISATSPSLDPELDNYEANLFFIYPDGQKGKVTFERSDTFQTAGMIFKVP